MILQSNKLCPIVEQYLSYLVVIKGRSENTILEYRTDLLMFLSSFFLHGKADIRSLQEILGHESIATTEIYTHIDEHNYSLQLIQIHLQ